MKRILILLLSCAMILGLSACGKNDTQQQEANQTEQSQITEDAAVDKEDNTEDNISTSDESKPDTNTSDNVDDESINNDVSAEEIRPEFKAAMDSYEAFYDEYCDFMIKYKANPTDTNLITEYSDMMKELVDVDTAFKEWENNDLNNEELKYYIDVNGRVSKKLLDVTLE